MKVKGVISFSCIGYTISDMGNKDIAEVKKMVQQRLSEATPEALEEVLNDYLFDEGNVTDLKVDYEIIED